MKSVINHDGLVKAKPFPKLMISHHSGNVVLFEREDVGTVVHLGQGNREVYRLGQRIEDFIMSHFKDFEGVLELSND